MHAVSCWVAEQLKPLAEFYRVFFWVTILIFAFHLFAQKWAKAFVSALLVFAVGGMPQVINATFRLGTCSP